MSLENEVARYLDSTTPARGKISLVIDGNVPKKLTSDINSKRWAKKRFKIVQCKVDGVSDHELLKFTKRQKAILVTCDKDFWSERQHKIRNCPGILLLPEAHDELLPSLANALEWFENVLKWPPDFRPAWPNEFKLKATATTLHVKYLDENNRVAQYTI